MTLHEFKQLPLVGPFCDKIYVCIRCGKRISFALVSSINFSYVTKNSHLYGDCDLEVINQVYKS